MSKKLISFMNGVIYVWDEDLSREYRCAIYRVLISLLCATLYCICRCRDYRDLQMQGDTTSISPAQNLSSGPEHFVFVDESSCETFGCCGRESERNNKISQENRNKYLRMSQNTAEKKFSQIHPHERNLLAI